MCVEADGGSSLYEGGSWCGCEAIARTVSAESLGGGDDDDG